MKILINDFGPLSEISFDLQKDIHLVYGKNAIGKSYAIYCIYCLLKSFKASRMYLRREIISSHYEDLMTTLIKKANAGDYDHVNVTADISRYYDSVYNEGFGEYLANSFQNTFSSLKSISNKLSNKNYCIRVILGDGKLTLQINGDKKGKPTFKLLGFEDKVTVIKKKTKSTKFSLYVNRKKKIGSPTEEEFYSEANRYIQLFLYRVNELLYKEIGNLYFLPASRSGLYQALNAFTPILAELTQNRFFLQSKNIELPSLTEPLSDYFIDLSTINEKHINKKLIDLVDIIQDEILRGKVIYDSATKKISFKPNNVDIDLDLSESSSMVAELSPIVLFIKHILNNKYDDSGSYYRIHASYRLSRSINRNSMKEILFIEEPEAHLHPEVQVKLMEVFSKLSSYGIKIFMTSHSNYMFNKINNLILSDSINEKKIEVHHLVSTEQGSKVNEGMSVSDEGIADDNFASVSEALYMERLDILEKSNND